MTNQRVNVELPYLIAGLIGVCFLSADYVSRLAADLWNRFNRRFLAVGTTLIFKIFYEEKCLSTKYS